MQIKTPYDLPFNASPEMDDLWTIFTSCPIEKGNVGVFVEFCKARNKAFEAINNKNLDGGNRNLDGGMGL